MKQSLSPESVAETLRIAPAHIARLQRYLAVLERWQARINLVGASTLSDPWRRHILDSAQVVPHLPAGARSVVDLGSGAGFPGLVLAILTGLDVVLIDSNARKCAFLREAARVTDTAVTVLNRRIETVSDLQVDAVTARACAPLPQLIACAAPFLKPGGRCLFLKGREIDAELTASLRNWMMRAERFPSLSDPFGTLLQLEDVRYRDDS